MFGYDNIGGKIKNCAKWIFVIEAIAAIVSGFALMTDDEDMIPIGLLVLVLGPIIAWIMSWVLYGYGQLIENSDIIAKEYIRKNEKYEKFTSKSNSREQKRCAEKNAQHLEKAKVKLEDYDVTDDEYIDITCPNCKEKLSYTKEQLQDGDVICPMCDTHILL